MLHLVNYVTREVVDINGEVKPLYDSWTSIGSFLDLDRAELFRDEYLDGDDWTITDAIEDDED